MLINIITRDKVTIKLSNNDVEVDNNDKVNNIGDETDNINDNIYNDKVNNSVNINNVSDHLLQFVL